MYKESIEGAEGKMKEFFDAAMKAFDGHLAEQFESEMGEVGPNAIGWKHPAGDDVVVSLVNGGKKWIFSVSFVKECFEKSEDGENELLLYLRRKFATA